MKKNEFHSYYFVITRNHLITILLVTLLLFVFKFKNIASGLLLGGILSAIIFHQFYSAIRSLPFIHKTEGKKKVFGLFFLKYIVIYLVLAVFLFLAIKESIYFFIGMAIGLLDIKIQIFVHQILGKK